MLSELAGVLIKNKCKDASWPLVAYEGRVSLHSSRLYSTLPAGTIQVETVKKSYLPTSYVQQLEKEQSHRAGEKVNMTLNHT